MKKLKRIMHLAFYPAMLVMEFNCYAFGSIGYLFIYAMLMTPLAAVLEYSLYRRTYQLEVCKGVVLELADRIDELESNRGDES